MGYTTEDLVVFEPLFNPSACDGTCYFELHPAELNKTSCWLPGSMFLRDAAFDFFVECFHSASRSFDYFSFVRFASEDIHRLIDELTLYLNGLKANPTREQLFSKYATIFTADIWSGVETQPLTNAVLNAGNEMRQFVRSKTKESKCLWVHTDQLQVSFHRSAGARAVILTSKILTISALLILVVLPVLPTSVPGHTSIKDTDSTSLPFDSANNLIVVKATLNGKGPFRFLLDTGASHHVMKPEIAQVLGLKVTDFGVLDAGGRGTVRAGSVRVSKLQVGGFTLEKQQFAVTSFPSSYPFDGFLGAELFKRFVVILDFKQSLITLAQPNAYRYQGKGVSLPIKFYDGLIPQVKGEVDDLAGWFKIDTGYNASLALFGKFIDENRLLAKYPPKTSTPGGLTLTGEVGDSPTAQIRKFKLGNLTLQNVLTSFFLEKAGSNSAFAGALGTVFLKQFKVIIDYPRQRIILEPEETRASDQLGAEQKQR